MNDFTILCIIIGVIVLAVALVTVYLDPPIE